MTPAAPTQATLPHAVTPAAPHKPSASPALHAQRLGGVGVQAAWTGAEEQQRPQIPGRGAEGRGESVAWGGTEGPRVSIQVTGSGRKLSEQAGAGERDGDFNCALRFPRSSWGHLGVSRGPGGWKRGNSPGGSVGGAHAARTWRGWLTETASTPSTTRPEAAAGAGQKGASVPLVERVSPPAEKP